MAPSTDHYLINSVLRATKILECFSPKKNIYTHTELSKKLGINRSSLTRLLYTLETAGFLEREENTRQYKLTYKLYRLGNIYINQTSLQEALPLLKKLAAACKETTHLSVLEGFEVSFIDWIEGPQHISLLSLTGMNLPAYCTSSGKVLLAHISQERLDEFFRSISLKSYTAKTIINPDELIKHLGKIKKQGYSMDYAEFQEDIVGIAAPVWDRSGEVVAAISVAGPLFRMNKKHTLNKIICNLKKTSQVLSKRLGFLHES